MIQEFNEAELEKLRKGLRSIALRDHPPHIMLREQLALTNDTLIALENFVTEYPFEDGPSEIAYYKHILPKFKSLQLYHIEHYALLDGRPLMGGKSLKKYYQDELLYIERFNARQQFLYEYFRLEMDNLDSSLFMGKNQLDHAFLPALEGYGTLAMPRASYVFSKFLAYERLRADILGLLRQLEQPRAMAGPIGQEKQSKTLRWTGDKTNLVEVIYGLFYTGQLNSGNATVADIIKWMEQHLQIDLSRSYKNFIDIKNRKRDSPTKFLDKMKSFILQRIDEDNAYRPNRGIGLVNKRDE